MNKAQKRRKISLVLTICLIVFFLLVATFASMLWAVSTENEGLKDLIKPVSNGHNTELYLDEATGYWTFVKDDIEDFRILQLTDTHIGASLFKNAEDEEALYAIKNLVEYTKPDLIILTGDLVFPVPVVGSMDNLGPTKLLAEFIDRFDIPWTLVYGNHDCESYSLRAKEEICDYYEGKGAYSNNGLKNCIFQRGPEFSADSKGRKPWGNTVINLKNTKDGPINTSIILMDSNMYATGFMYDYDNIHDDQVEWYKNTIKELSKDLPDGEVVKSLAFFHIPFNEYMDAWNAYLQSDPAALYYYGGLYEKGSVVSSPSKENKGKIFDAMVELGSTKGTFVGHDHENNFSIEYMGIRMTYGMSVDYLAYAVDPHRITRGGTVISVDNNSDFYVAPVPLADIATIPHIDTYLQEAKVKYNTPV